MNEEVAEVLERSAALLEMQGWIQHDEHTVNGFCSIGAIGYYTDSQSCLYEQTVNALACLVAPDLMPNAQVVVSWNDDDDRTKQEVLDAFHLAAKRTLGVEV